MAGRRQLTPGRSASEDRAAAGQSGPGRKKKKLRKRRRPIYTRGWFVVIACLGLLVGMGWGDLGVRPRPASAESLLQKLEAAKDPDEQRSIAAKYLKHYGNRDDDATKKVKALDRDLKVAEREHVLLNRFGRENLRSRAEADDDPDAYRKTMAALTAENDGDLAAAKTMWVELVDRYSNESSDAKKLWAWHAQKKLNDLTLKSRQLNELIAQLDKMRLEDVDVKFDGELQTRVAAAIRLEQLGDFFARARPLGSNCQDAQGGSEPANGVRPCVREDEGTGVEESAAEGRGRARDSDFEDDGQSEGVARQPDPGPEARRPQPAPRYPRPVRRRVGGYREARRTGEKAPGGESGSVINASPPHPDRRRPHRRPGAPGWSAGVCMYVLLGVLLLSRHLAKKWVGSLAAVRECSAKEAVEVGAIVKVKLRLTNTGNSRVAWVLIEDLFPEHYLRQKPPRVKITGKRMKLCSVAGGGVTLLEYEIECRPAAIYQLGPTLLETGDLFGLHRQHVITGDHAHGAAEGAAVAASMTSPRSGRSAKSRCSTSV